MSQSPPYPVQNVLREWMLDPEDMGTKAKFWYEKPGEDPEDNTFWLFKFPRKGTGEHWSEKIASEVAKLLKISHGEIQLAEFYEDLGSSARNFVGTGMELRHGNQLLAEVISGYDKCGRRFEQTSHTLENIWHTFDRIVSDPDSITSTKVHFAHYLILDAIIGNTDRHHENWGVLLRRHDGGYLGKLAPSFDHASSLGRELSDKGREDRLKDNRVGEYSERGRGGIYWHETDERAPSSIELVRRAARNEPSLFEPALDRAARVSEDEMRMIVDRIPAGWMSEPARAFAIALMCYNVGELRKLAP